MLCTKMFRGRQSMMTNYARCYFSSGSLRSSLLVETSEVQDLIAQNDPSLRLINASWYLAPPGFVAKNDIVDPVV